MRPGVQNLSFYKHLIIALKHLEYLLLLLVITYNKDKNHHGIFLLVGFVTHLLSDEIYPLFIFGTFNKHCCNTCTVKSVLTTTCE